MMIVINSVYIVKLSLSLSSYSHAGGQGWFLSFIIIFAEVGLLRRVISLSQSLHPNTE
jgi:hypothetical protein